LHIDEPWSAVDQPYHSRPDDDGQEKYDGLHLLSLLVASSVKYEDRQDGNTRQHSVCESPEGGLFPILMMY